MGTLDNRVAIVSGSGRGIGREIALKLASEGARVVVNDLDEIPAKDTVADIQAAGGDAVACVGSVTEEGFATRFTDSAIEAFGGLDIIVNNAGYTWDTVIQKMTDEQWDAILDVHLRAPFQILRAAQPYIRSNPTEYHRKVVNISSASGVFGSAGQANYASAKAGLIGLTKTLAKEWGRYKVNVNAVAFGWILTRMTEAVVGQGDAFVDIDGRKIKVGVSEQFAASAAATIPVGRPGTPQEAAAAVYMLCTKDADYVSGQCLNVNGGKA
ncbi:3-oxoacyl-[acyl-carrier protein] reductase [Rhodococcus wratislaviensis]|uniref:3-oxoacyl-[acyl-carrier-protein] reductase MabA n=2 Tax=Rhodococcus wratislaviensis TaxID=44752 RepID=A0AB38F682_RHOWR|nr:MULTISPECIES: SDR family oxidoreductase [Rhodococcus]REE70723.1 3-oxoacyl-[acyl-carrier protein] reductase [Rhodococcus wratislaviensis]WAM14797.1 SDR family oxidoreductase [Rhodococcus sp. JS3073]GAF45299.1 putative 3-oxoacyl-[acyl-carrier-protein] reductase [Rhodococcus wratislaviensis NBRC 100605]SPZ34914.1 3-oxoacyl-ACP reductase [Rhodococcus wratislaviensis]